MSRGRENLDHIEILLPHFYLELLEGRHLAVATQEAWAVGLERFQRFLAQRRRVRASEISPRAVVEFHEWLSAQRVQKGGRAGQPLASGTVQLCMTAVRRFCRWLMDTDVLLLDPCQDLPRFRKRQTLPHVLTVGQVNQLLAGTGSASPVEQRDRAMMELLYAAGLRVGELHALDLTDLDLVAGEVLIRSSKNGESRRIPIGPPAVAALRKYIDDAREDQVTDLPPGIYPAVLLGRASSRLTATRVEQIVRERARAVGLPGRVTPHTLRHSAAVHLLKGGADIRFIQAFLGHRSVETTVHYTRLDLEDLKKTLARCHPRGPRETP